MEKREAFLPYQLAVDNSGYHVVHIAEAENDDVSDISGDEDFPKEPQHVVEEQGYDNKLRRLRIVWTTQKEDYLLRCYNQCRLTNWNNHGLKGKSWRKIAYRMTDQFQEDYDAKSCRNKLNVLRYEYLAYLAVVQIRQSFSDHDAEVALLTLFEKNPRAAKYKDTVFSHVDIMHKIVNQHGEGVEPVPELEMYNGNLARPNQNASPNKRIRTEAPQEINWNKPYKNSDVPLNALRGTRNSLKEQEISYGHLQSILQNIAHEMHKGLNEISQIVVNHKTIELDFSYRAMKELDKQRYAPFLSDKQRRDDIVMMLRDPTLARDFIMYPEAYRHHFIEELIQNMALTLNPPMNPPHIPTQILSKK